MNAIASTTNTTTLKTTQFRIMIWNYELGLRCRVEGSEFRPGAVTQSGSVCTRTVAKRELAREGELVREGGRERER